MLTGPPFQICVMAPGMTQIAPTSRNFGPLA
jgi:hypothetical protein